MFKKILIANRGEIALQVIRACREMGIESVVVYSEGDRDSLPVKFADEAICIGPADSASSYLHIPSLISAAEITGAEAIHPGYGFLAENANFAEVCEMCRIAFIGPQPEVLKLMGNKWEARQEMARVGIAVLPGSHPTGMEDALEAARQIGFPVIVKAQGGGGGKGMRLVYEEEKLPSAFMMAQREAQAAFGDPGLYLERYIEKPRHVEFQILADSRGNVIHLGERDCTIQRRYQKVIEESPSPALSRDLWQEMGEVAVKAAQTVGYLNAGTIEFLLDPTGNYYFTEMNTRIQVEHPVTEMITQINMVKEQFRIAAGEELRWRQRDIKFSGHALECRICAEDPDTFAPSPGRISVFHLPGGNGVRVDTAAHTDCLITPYYDSMIAKLIVRGENRRESIAKMLRSLEEFTIEGVKTNIPLHLKILRDKDFIRGEFFTDFLSRYKEAPGSKLKAQNP
ncbi:MAG: acetyl-CoA carboxylase biotin carboxylase subunit [Candidatus Tectomicrobia bacterium]|uniref:Biotin carboxylase n=1 Tax=Tectimicrobiota bacterium TaxID=2528274 RepID=A0A932FVR7_UNCTE|nr:acetyl-CoA carboxylase biotin carboxylase subunit [Candidatus Tectomicrobia bacterium]